MFSLKRLAACMLLVGFVIGLAPKPALAAITYDDRKLWRDANNDGIKQDAEVADIGVRLDIHRHDENENVPDLPGINSSPLPPSGFWIEAWIFNTSSQVLFLFNVDSSAKLAMKSVFFDDPSHYLKKLNETDKNWNTYSERLYNPFLSNMVKDTKDITVELNAGGKLIDDEAANVNADVFAVGGATANDMSGLVGNPAQIVAPHSTLPGISANNP